jgi:hypothetical protein
MPVRRFRSVEEMERPLWRQPGDRALYTTIAQIWAFGRQTDSYQFPPGVYRHGSVDEMDAQTRRWSAARVAERQSQRASET